MTGKDVAYIAGSLAVGFVAFRVYKGAAAAIDSGAGVVAAITDGAKKVITEDLNPASDKNVVYGGVNKVVQAATGQKDETFGGWLYSLFNKDPVKVMDAEQAALPDPKTYDAYDLQDAPLPVRASTSNPKQAIVETAQTSFRLSELNSQYGSDSKFDAFLKTLSGQ